jgi:hypothetical protein
MTAEVLDMVFLFDTACIDYGKEYRFWARDWKLSEFKAFVNRYQHLVEGVSGWSTTYL